MLGLGHSLSSHTPSEGSASNDVTYTSDFSSGVDGFSAYFDNSPSAATLTGNQDFGGKTDVLKVSWSAAEADGVFYVRRVISELSNESQPNPSISFDIYFDFDGATSVNTYAQAGHPTSGTYNMFSGELNANQWNTVTGSLPTDASQSFDGYIYIGFLDATDKPASGDNMYIANIEFTFSDNN